MRRFALACWFWEERGVKFMGDGKFDPQIRVSGRSVKQGWSLNLTSELSGRVKRTPKFGARGGRKGKTDPQIWCPGYWIASLSSQWWEERDWIASLCSQWRGGEGLDCHASLVMTEGEELDCHASLAMMGGGGIASLKRGGEWRRDSGFLFF